jgi:hypothetical protein
MAAEDAWKTAKPTKHQKTLELCGSGTLQPMAHGNRISGADWYNRYAAPDVLAQAIDAAW